MAQLYINYVSFTITGISELLLKGS